MLIKPKLDKIYKIPYISQAEGEQENKKDLQKY